MSDGLDEFLAHHPPIASGASVKDGETIGRWRISAFIGKGGSGEVYRAENLDDGLVAAVKIFTGESAGERFAHELEILKTLPSGPFPALYDSGLADGHRFIAMELLESAPLPRKDAEVAKFAIAVAGAVRLLHERGFVHRDLKPKNILSRGGGPVLIDFALAERVGTPIEKVSGTPGFVAPEQFDGGTITPLIDIHALGVLLDRCFDGHPPRIWARIIDRATSSIPARRFKDVASFVRAIRLRHLARYCAFGAFVVILFGAVLLNGVAENRQTAPQAAAVKLIVDQKGTDEKVIDLKGETVRLEAPLELQPGMYRIHGPGVLDADIRGTSAVTVRTEKCVILNETMLNAKANAIHYILGRGTYLNFVRLDNDYEIRSNVRIPDGTDVELRFKGPMSVGELRKHLDREWRRELE